MLNFFSFLPGLQIGIPEASLQTPKISSIYTQDTFVQMSHSVATTNSSLDSIPGDFSFDTDSLLDFDFDFAELTEADNHFTLPEVLVTFDDQSTSTMTSIEDTFETPESERLSVVDEPPKVTHKPAKSGVTKLATKKKASKKNAAIIKGMISGTKAPNMSRRTQGSVLCAFPAFDKCDSLVFLPNSISKFMNNGDVDGMAALLTSHTAKDCGVTFKGMDLQLAGFLYINELVGQLHPDTVSCVHTTKVVGNTILATLFSKFTDSDAIFESVARVRAKEPQFQSMFGGDGKCSSHAHADRWKKKIEPMANKTEEEKQQLISVAQTPGDIIVYANMYLKLTFDDFTRKVTKIDYDYELTSLSTAADAKKNGR